MGILVILATLVAIIVILLLIGIVLPSNEKGGEKSDGEEIEE
jgi:preprotein translocase subunit SecG